MVTSPVPPFARVPPPTLKEKMKALSRVWVSGFRSSGHSEVKVTSTHNDFRHWSGAAAPCGREVPQSKSIGGHRYRVEAKKSGGDKYLLLLRKDRQQLLQMKRETPGAQSFMVGLLTKLSAGELKDDELKAAKETFLEDCLASFLNCCLHQCQPFCM